MDAHSNGQKCPEVSAEERALRDHVKRIRKLRWIGKEDEAARIQNKLERSKSRLKRYELAASLRNWSSFVPDGAPAARDKRRN